MTAGESKGYGGKLFNFLALGEGSINFAALRWLCAPIGTPCAGVATL